MSSLYNFFTHHISLPLIIPHVSHFHYSSINQYNTHTLTVHAHDVCPESFQPCSMKNRDTDWTRYKIQETWYIGQWCLSPLQSRHLETSHSSPSVSSTIQNTAKSFAEITISCPIIFFSAIFCCYCINLVYLVKFTHRLFHILEIVFLKFHCLFYVYFIVYFTVCFM